MTVIETYIRKYNENNPVNVFNNVSYKSTNEIAKAADINNVNDPTIITASYFKNVLLFIPAFLLDAFYSYSSISKSIFNILPFVIVLIITVILFIEAIQKKRNQEIELYADGDKLIIKKQTFKWKDITNAYIMIDNAGRTADKFLLLEFDNGDINRISINYLSISTKQLAAIIEHFKTHS